MALALGTSVFELVATEGASMPMTVAVGLFQMRVSSEPVPTTSTPSRLCVKSWSRKTGSRRVYQRVVATRLTSSSSCTAEMPPPTIATRRPAKSEARR